MAKRTLPLFYKIFFSVLMLAVCAVGVGLWMLNGVLEEYESVQPRTSPTRFSQSITPRTTLTRLRRNARQKIRLQVRRMSHPTCMRSTTAPR